MMSTEASHVAFHGWGNDGVHIGINSGTVQTHQHYYSNRAETPPSPTLLIPFRRDRGFVERRELFEQIEESCAVAGSWTALVGLGGVGKSQLAIEYAYRVRERSSETWVFWVHASNATRFEQSYRDIATRANISGRQDPNANIFELVHEWLDNSKRRWVLVLDNFDDAGFLCQDHHHGTGTIDRPLRDYLPRGLNGSMLITSRNRVAACSLVSEMEIVQVAPMSEDDALKLLQLRVTIQDRREAVELVSALDFMPLAIAQAASYISNRQPRCSIKQYLERLREGERTMVHLLSSQDRKIGHDREAKTPILTAWQISFNHIRQTMPSAADLLSLMAFFDRQGIPELLLRGHSRQIAMQNEVATGDKEGYLWSAEKPQTSEEQATDSRLQASDFEENILMLRDYSFVTIGTDHTTFEIHRLVQLATRLWLDANGELARWKGQAIKTLSTAFPWGGEFEDWNTCQILFPHAKAVTEHRPKEPEILIEWATLFRNAALFALKKGRISEAIEFGELAMQTLQSTLREDDERTLNSIAVVGAIYLQGGRWKEAEALCERVLDKQKEVLGAEHSGTVISMNNLAMIYQHRGRLSEAEELLESSLQIHKKTHGDEHPHTLSFMNNLALTYNYRGRWSEAEDLQVQVLELYKRTCGDEHPETLNSMGNLALTYSKQSRWGEAEVLFARGLEMQKKVLGLEHPHTLTTMCNLAATWSIRGRAEEAIKLMEECVKLRTLRLGTDHPDTISASEQLSRLRAEKDEKS